MMGRHSIIYTQGGDTFNDYLSDYICWMEFRGWSHRTIENYTINIKQLINFIRRETDVQCLDEINPRIIHQYQHFLYHLNLKSDKYLSISSQHTKLVCIRSFFKYLYLIHHIHIDPSLIQLPVKGQNLPKNILSECQIETILQQPDLKSHLGVRNRAILELFYASGIRNSELRNLTVYDINLSQMQLMVRKGKNGKDRIVPIGEITAKYIDDYLSNVRSILCSTYSTNILFLSKSGRKITKANLIWIVAHNAKKAGIGSFITPHTFRHSCATHMLQRGADIRYIQELLGHASVATTQIYTRVLIADLKKVFRETHPRAVNK